MHYIKLIREFFKVSAQAEMAYRANFFIRLLHSTLNLGTGVLSLVVIFNQVESVRGWDLPGALALLGIYLLNEPVVWATMVGGAMVLGGVAMVNVNRRPQTKPGRS